MPETYVHHPLNIKRRYILDSSETPTPGAFTFQNYSEDNIMSSSVLMGGSSLPGAPVTFSQECVDKLKELGYIQDQRKPLRFKYDSVKRGFQYEQDQPDSIVFHPAQVEHAEFAILNVDKCLNVESDKKADIEYGAQIAAIPRLDQNRMINFRKIYYPEPILNDEAMAHIKKHYTFSKNISEFPDAVTRYMHPLIFMHLRRLIPKSPHCTALRGIAIAVDTIDVYFQKKYLKEQRRHAKAKAMKVDNKGEDEEGGSDVDDDENSGSCAGEYRILRRGFGEDKDPGSGVGADKNLGSGIGGVKNVGSVGGIRADETMGSVGGIRVDETAGSGNDDDRPAARTSTISARTERAKAIKAAKAAARAAAKEAAEADANATTNVTPLALAFVEEAQHPRLVLTPEELEAAKIAEEKENLERLRKESEERQAKYAEHCAAAARQEKLEREQKRVEAEERRRAKEAAASIAAEAAARAREEAVRAREAARQEKKHGKKRN